MKGSDYITDFLADHGVTDVFGYPGALVCHLMDSLDKANRIHARLNYHEQGSAFAACGYALASKTVGVAYANGGPGATNLISGIANAWYDSLPTIFITGQVDTTAMRGELPIRQRGIQELPIAEVVKPICKLSICVKQKEQLRYCMERAWWEAVSGRPGPVVLEIPADIQRAEIDIDNSPSFESPDIAGDEAIHAEMVLDYIKKAKRPCLLVGNGVKVARHVEEFRTLVDHLGIPVVFTLSAFDLLPFDHPLNFGFIGSNGHRYSNFILGKADLIVTLGTRLGVKHVGNNRKGFALQAELIRIDVDERELCYPVRDGDTQIQADLIDFLPAFLGALGKTRFNYEEWQNVCCELKSSLEGFDFSFGHQMLRALGDRLPENCCVTADVGQHEIYLTQAMRVKSGQRVLLSTGLASMGFSIPAAIGAHYARRAPVLALCGDGGLQMNIQEIQCISRDQLPVKVVVFNNQALGMIREFQERNFASRFVHSLERGGYTTPDTEKIAAAYRLPYCRVSEISELAQINFSDGKPGLIEMMINQDTYMAPRMNRDAEIQDMLPELDRELYNRLMAL